MNFLQLVQRLHSEAGRQGTAPSTVLSQIGMNARLVNWILKGYEDVQQEHETWLFRRDDFSFETISGTQTYTPLAAGIDDFGAWYFDPDHSNLSGIRIYSSASDEQDLIFFPWDEFRANYKYGSFRTQSSRPTIFSIKPNMSMELWATPDAVYTVNGEYIKTTQTMTANADEPLFSDYHMVIVWKALMYYGAYEGAPEVYAHGEKEYRKMLAKLEINQLPKITYGAPLA